MLETPAGLGQLIAILMMAAALGMDAFSLGIGIGMKGIRLLHVLKISVLIGLFHILMPLIGMYTGQYMSSLLGQVADYVAGDCSSCSAFTWYSALSKAERPG